MSELRPCPFCDPTEYTTQEDPIASFEQSESIHGATSKWIECAYCGSRGPSEGTWDDAIWAWNRRAALDGNCNSGRIGKKE